MAAFSSSSSPPFHHHHPFLLDSVFLQNSSTTIDHHHTHTKNLNFSPHLLPHHYQSPPADSISTSFNHQNLIQNPDHSNDASLPNKHSMDNNSSSIVTDKPHMKKRKYSKQASSPNSAQSKDKREVKGKKQKKIKEIASDDEEKKKIISNSKESKGYIHVRARRGQATDSHSLAERVRRERISERMKLLQTLVPGCDKVTGKALMLDEIINYVQSLQNQVEFLSMKLATVNPMFYDFGVDLESFMARPDQDLSELPSMQECSPTIANNYNFVENPAANNAILFQQNLLPQPQGSRQSLWEVDEQRQKIINQSGFNNSHSHSLFSFH